MTKEPLTIIVDDREARASRVRISWMRTLKPR